MWAIVNYMFLFFIYWDIKLSNLEFAWEPIPEESYRDIERKIVWNNKQFLKRLYIKNKEREILPYIESQIQERRLPDDLKYISYVESSLQTWVVSENWKVGLWQISKEVWDNFWMNTKEGEDERYDIKVSTSVALEQLITLNDRLGSWMLSGLVYSLGSDHIDWDAQAGWQDYNTIKSTEGRNYILNMAAYKYGR